MLSGGPGELSIPGGSSGSSGSSDELADTKRQLMQMQEAYAAKEPGPKYGKMASGAFKSFLPPGVGETVGA